MSVDALGNPLRFILTGGQKHDITQAQGLIADHAGEYVIADKGYDSREFRQYILERGMRPVIPPRSNRKEPQAYDACDACLPRAAPSGMLHQQDQALSPGILPV